MAVDLVAKGFRHIADKSTVSYALYEGKGLTLHCSPAKNIDRFLWINKVFNHEGKQVINKIITMEELETVIQEHGTKQ